MSDPEIFGYDIPTGRRLQEGDHPKNWVGSIGDGNDVTDQGLDVARQKWSEADASDFERTGRWRWRDRVSGAEYRRSHGAPLLSVGSPIQAPVSVFFVLDGRFYFLEPDEPQGQTQTLGSISSWQATGRERK